MDETISIEELIDIINGEIYGDCLRYEDHEDSDKLFYITNFLQKNSLEYCLDQNSKNIHSGFIITTSNFMSNNGTIHQEYGIYLTIGFQEIPLIIFTSNDSYITNKNKDYEDWLYTSTWDYKFFNNVRLRKEYMVEKLGEPELMDAPYEWVEKLYKIAF